MSWEGTECRVRLSCSNALKDLMVMLNLLKGPNGNVKPDVMLDLFVTLLK